MLVTFFIVFSMVYARLGGGYTPSPAAGWSVRRRATMRALPSIALAALIIGGIYGGAFTPTEAAAVGFAAALLITGAILRSLTWQAFKAAAFEAMVTTVAVLLIVAGAKIFGKAITLYRIPQEISAAISASFDTLGLFVLAVSVLLMLMGLIFETLSMILIMTPVLLPAMQSLGVDPIWFGIFMVIMVECALITPPVGLNLYVIQSVANVRLGEVAWGVVPFIAMMLLTVGILYVWPDVALYIPFKL